MTDDPDELRYEHAISQKDPAVVIAAIEEIEVHLRYELPKIKWALRGIFLLLLVAIIHFW